LDLELTPADVAFREELRAFLEATIAHAGDPRVWHARLVEGGWVVPSWPRRWGGREATITQQLIFEEEFGRYGAPGPRNAIALYNIGPMLMQHATAAQQERYIPKMVTAEEIWCQGFSEPGAGSDLAALRTRAEDRGDHWLVNGQKTWNTFGHEADLCLALCRTDPGAPKHEGISALIVDMHHHGVEVRPLRDITGETSFNELFFTDVEVPKGDVVGPVNSGWKVAMSTLAFERLGTMKLGVQLRDRLERLVALAHQMGRRGDPVIRQRTAALAVQVELMQLLAEQVIEALQRGVEPGALLPLGKLQWSELSQDLAELGLAIQGPLAELWHDSPHEVPGGWQQQAVHSRMTTIGAGTTEVQKNIIAYRVLGLPRDASSPSRPALSRDRPLDEERDQLRATVRRFLAERAPISYVRQMLDHPQGFTEEVWRGIVGLGLPGILVPEEHGGLGLGLQEMGIVAQEMGRALHPGPFFSSALGAVSAILIAGTKQQQADLLEGLAAGTTIATLALFEAGSGYDWTRVSTQARPADGGWLVSGTKILVPDAAAAHRLLVTARAGDELALFAVDARDADVRALSTVDQTRRLAEVSLRDASAQRLGTSDITAGLADAVDRVVCGLVADAVGAADRTLEVATEYAKVRVQFDQPIGSFQAVQHKLADMLRNVELARGAVIQACRLADGEDRAAFHRAAVTAKAFASDALYRVGADAIQVLGGIGFTWEHDAHLFYKRIMSMQHAFGGTAEHQEEYARLLFPS